MKLWDEARHGLAHTIAYHSGRILAATALSGGLRRTLGWAQEVMFLGMVEELERQHISRKVASDMLGMTLRTYQRHVASVRINQATGLNAWHMLYSRLSAPTSRPTILSWFEPGRAPKIISLLHDMVSAGWLALDAQDRYLSQPNAEGWSREKLDDYVQLQLQFIEADPDLEAWAEEIGVEPARLASAIERARLQASSVQRISSDYATYSLFKLCMRHCMDLMTMQHKHQATYSCLTIDDLDPAQRAELTRELTALHEQAAQIVGRYEQDSKLEPLDVKGDIVRWSVLTTYPEPHRARGDGQ